MAVSIMPIMPLAKPLARFIGVLYGLNGVKSPLPFAAFASNDQGVLSRTYRISLRREGQK